MSDLLRREEFEARTLLTIKEVREVFGIARSTVYRWLDRCWLRKAGQVQAPEEQGSQKITLLEILDPDLQVQFDEWQTRERAEGRTVQLLVQELAVVRPVELEDDGEAGDPNRLLAELDVLLERLSRQTIERERLLTELHRADRADRQDPLVSTRSRLQDVLESLRDIADREEDVLVERVDLPHPEPVRDNPVFLYELGEERGAGLESGIRSAEAVDSDASVDAQADARIDPRSDAETGEGGSPDEPGGPDATPGPDRPRVRRRRPWELVDLDSIPAPLGDSGPTRPAEPAGADTGGDGAEGEDEGAGSTDVEADDEDRAIAFLPDAGEAELEIDFDGEGWVELNPDEDNPMLREELLALDEAFLKGSARRGVRIDVDKGMLSEVELDALGELEEADAEAAEDLPLDPDRPIEAVEDRAPVAASSRSTAGGSEDIVDPTGGSLGQGELAILNGDADLGDIEFEWEFDLDAEQRVELELDTSNGNEPLHPVMQKALDQRAKGPSETQCDIAPELDLDPVPAQEPTGEAKAAQTARDEIELEDDEDVSGMAGEEEEEALHLEDLEDLEEGVLLSFEELDRDEEPTTDAADPEYEEAYAQAFDEAMGRAEDHVELEVDDVADTRADEAWLAGDEDLGETGTASGNEDRIDTLPHLSTEGSWLADIEGSGDGRDAQPWSNEEEPDARAAGGEADAWSADEENVVFDEPEPVFDQSAGESNEGFQDFDDFEPQVPSVPDDRAAPAAGEHDRAALPAAALVEDPSGFEPGSEMVKEGMMGIRLSILEVKEGLGILQEPVEKFSQNSESMRAGIEEMVAHAKETRRAIEGLGDRILHRSDGVPYVAGGTGHATLVSGIGLALLVLTWCLGLWLRTEGSRTSLYLVLGANLLITTSVLLLRRQSAAPARS